ncbi:ATP-binding cassette domain-containing protein [Mesorhizobium sp. M0622]|uniref:ATP-binding cassette domain-containing protein n=1 Tax=unclassified Mesorhizobium TaxID=325217 RepID=UPI00333D7802
MSVNVLSTAAAAVAARGTPLIAARGISKWYGAVNALKPTDFHVGRNEIVGLVGDNGAGKSTLIKILAGAHKPTEGHIEVDGKPVVLNSTRDAMRLGIETIYQYNAMIPQMSIARNIFIGREPIRFSLGPLRIMDFDRMSREAMKSVETLDLGLRDADTPVSDLSGGQRQAVVIARAMHFKSKVLILDEPTNHLSVKETNKVLDQTARLKEQNISAVFISHNMHHVHAMSDRIVAMARGHKIAEMAKDEVTVEDLHRILGES